MTQVFGSLGRMTLIFPRPNLANFSGTLAGKIAVLVALVLTLAGCAAGPSPNPAGRAKDDKTGSSSHENVEVDAGVQADFDTALKYLQGGEYEKGVGLLKKVTQRSPGHAAPYIDLAIAYQKMGDLSAAEDNVKKALAIDPDHPIANTEYGLIYRKTGRFAQARKSYERALARYPGFLPARKNLGILCDMYLQDLACALTQYRIYSQAMPDDKTVRIWIADLEQRLGKQKH